METAGHLQFITRSDPAERLLRAGPDRGALDAVDAGSLAGWTRDCQPEDGEAVAAGQFAVYGLFSQTAA
jgi:hypothetical protein